MPFVEPIGIRDGIATPEAMSGDTCAWWSAGVPLANNALRTADVLYAATMGGAHALGMADSLGSITPANWPTWCW
ncbi:amidohydrolase family protein [Streptomyces sp. GESEQ-4]|uniref:amidohydrolase family protein n=1 Tax=Streptomyces sp. GESEQ-4 TaxID=2812655 RepID=UPI001B33D47B|nr:amidohydrolase family protein [Streptomyces sp. GESEQ-4]